MTPYHIFQTVTVHIMESVYQSGLFRDYCTDVYICFISQRITKELHEIRYSWSVFGEEGLVLVTVAIMPSPQNLG